MDYSYAPPGKRQIQNSGTPSKRQKQDLSKNSPDFSDLPTHLPNTKPEHDKPVAEVIAPKKEPIFIEGTSITLQTEEDIAKWIEERKKNWPSRRNVEAKMKIKDQEPTPVAAPRNVCKFYSKTGKCKFGNKCKNLHESSGTKTINGLQVVIPQRYKKFAEGLLYKKMVQRDLYEHENNVIIDFIEFLDAQKLLNKDVSA